MGNGKQTLTERVLVLETDYKITINDIKNDLAEVKTDIKTIVLDMGKRNGEKNKRKTDQPRYKYMVWSAIVTGIAGIIIAVLK